MTRSEMVNLCTEHRQNCRRSYPLYSCSASVLEAEPLTCYVLRSYSTIVAVADCTYAHRKVYVFDYYSATTNGTHISRFIRWLREHLPFGYYEIVPLYKHSRMGKRAYAALSSDDWSGVIDDSVEPYLKRFAGV